MLNQLEYLILPSHDTFTIYYAAIYIYTDHSLTKLQIDSHEPVVCCNITYCKDECFVFHMTFLHVTDSNPGLVYCVQPITSDPHVSQITNRARVATMPLTATTREDMVENGLTIEGGSLIVGTPGQTVVMIDHAIMTTNLETEATSRIADGRFVTTESPDTTEVEGTSIRILGW